MKKIITISSVLLGAVFLAGCGQKPVSQTQPETPASVAQDPTTNQPATTPAENKVATDFACGSEIKDASGITYGTVVAEDGKCWLDRNLGAKEIATSPTDEASYGWLFQWGRGADGHQSPISETTATLSATDTPGHANFITKILTPPDWRSTQNDNLWQGVSGINNPCPTGFSVPTQLEWSALASASHITNSTTAFNSSLRLALAGGRDIDGALFKQGILGYYWSSNPVKINGSAVAFDLVIGSGVNVGPSIAGNRVLGLSVRCLKN
jgi:uncharacterized protein (TIGR02145 family)